MPSPAHLAIDLGAESGRAIVGVLAAGGLELHEVHRFPNVTTRLPSGMHWDVPGLWRGVLEGLRRAILFTRERGLTLESLGVDTWGVDYGLVDGTGELVSPPYAYRDPRTTQAFEDTMATLGVERLYDATGIQPMAINTLFQLVADAAADPIRLTRTDKLLFMPDLLHFFLTGRACVEATIASTSQMIDPRTGTWATAILESLDLPTHFLVPTIPAGTPIGPLLPHIAREVDAPAGLQVVAPASHDTASAVAAVPADADSSWCFLSSGTWSLLGAELDAPCLTAAARAVPFTNEGGLGGTIRFLKNLTGLWIVQECHRAFAREGREQDYDELTRLAQDAEPFRCLIDPEQPMFTAPGDMPRRIRDYAQATDQPEPAEPGPLVRCVLESIALTYRRTLGWLESTLDRRFDVIHLVGGGGRNRLLSQMAADATGRRVVVGPYEATAAGNVLVQAMATGHLPGASAIRPTVAAGVRLETFAPRDTAAWTRAAKRLAEFPSLEETTLP